MVPASSPQPQSAPAHLLRSGAAPVRLPSLAGRLHEVHAEGHDHAAAAAFALHLAGAGAHPVLWVRGQPRNDSVRGCGLYGAGLAGLGIAPARLIIVTAHDRVGEGRTGEGLALLRAGLDGARCAGLGAVVIEGGGRLPAYDLTASRRLVLAAETSGVGVVMLRGDAMPRASAAHVRWRVASAPSPPVAGEVGGGAFTAEILRQRGGPAGLVWQMTWDASDGCFHESRARTGAGDAALSGAVVSPFPLRAEDVDAGEARAA